MPKSKKTIAEAMRSAFAAALPQLIDGSLPARGRGSFRQEVIGKVQKQFPDTKHSVLAATYNNAHNAALEANEVQEGQLGVSAPATGGGPDASLRYHVVNSKGNLQATAQTRKAAEEALKSDRWEIVDTQAA
jgi:hypothetical protein